MDVQAENLQKPPAQQQPMPEWLKRAEQETQVPAAETQVPEATHTAVAEDAPVNRKRVEGVRFLTYSTCHV